MNLESFFTKHPKAKLVLKGFGYLFSERMIRFAIGFFVHALVARYLGPEKFGKLSYIMKTVGVFATFSLFGVDELILSHLMKGQFKREDVLKTAFTLRFYSAVIGFISLILFVLLFQKNEDGFAWLTIVYGLQLFLLIFSLFDLDYQAKLSFKPLFWANFVSSMLASFLRVVGVFTHQAIPFFVFTYLLGDIVLRSSLQWKLGFQVFKGRLKKELAVKIAKNSTPFFVAAFVIILDQRISYFYIEKYLSLSDLGNYSVAVTLVDLWVFLPLAVCSALFPTIVTAYHNSEINYKLRKQSLSDVMVWLALLFSLGIYLSADLIIHILYGERYLEAPEIIRYYSLVTIPVFFNLARTKWLALEDHLIDWLSVCVVTLFLNLVGHIYLVPKLGLKGAIISFLTAQLVGNLLSCFVLKTARESLIIFFKSLSAPIRLIKSLK